jgi:6,7-dimethyl-8-ribityllumazine synthase
VLKSIHLGPYPLRAEDYRVVTRFFRAIGFDYHHRRRFATFLTSRASLMLSFRQGKSETTTDGPGMLAARLNLEVSNPEVIRDIAERMKLAVHASNSRSEGRPSFSIELPGKLWVSVRETGDVPVAEQGSLEVRGKRFAIVVSRFNAFITERLLSGAQDALSRLGARGKNITVVRVPGAFEIPATARSLAASKNYDAIICLGCLLRGDTLHYDVIASEVTRGIGQSAQETGVPHAFGVLTCDSLEQAIDRAGLKMGNKGFEAALAAAEMANLNPAATTRRPSPQDRGKAVYAQPAVFAPKRRPSARSEKNKRNPPHPSRRIG